MTVSLKKKKKQSGKSFLELDFQLKSFFSYMFVIYLCFILFNS